MRHRGIPEVSSADYAVNKVVKVGAFDPYADLKKVYKQSISRDTTVRAHGLKRDGLIITDHLERTSKLKRRMGIRK